MTFLEKAIEIENKKENGLSKEKILARHCPSSYGLEDGRRCNYTGQEKCFDCWNREMPNTEMKQKVVNPPTKEVLDTIKQNIKVIPQEEIETWENAHASGKAEGYEQGLNDAWELAKKLFAEAQECVLDEIFGKSWSYNSIMKLTPQEALAKLKAYEDSKIEVGDVVETTDTFVVFKGVVLEFVDNTENEVRVLALNGDKRVDVWKVEICKKTGKHLDISSILEQIGE